MRFEMDNILTDEILFHMENQDGEFLLDTHEGKIIDKNDNEVDGERFTALPEWSSSDGYRIMEKFTAGLKNPIARQELSAALNRNKGVFRSFKDTLEQYPEIEKLWFRFKEREMKNVVVNWYNALREEWGLEPLGAEPEDTSSLVLEDFVLKEGNEEEREKARALHKLCVEEREDKETFAIFEALNPFVFPGDFCVIAETANGDFSGFICAVNDSPSALKINALEVKGEYRGMGLAKALLSKLLEKADERKFTVTIDLPAGMEYFARALHLEEFKPCVQRFVRISL